MTALGAALSLALLLPAPAHAQAVPPGEGFAAELLAAHNRERDRLHIPRLKWSQRLAAQAAAWSANLARRDVMEHAAADVRGGAGENLWMGSAGYFSAQEMVGAFVAEGRNFRPGRFPANSATGQWSDVGHYTQVIWPGTQEVGCAVTNSRRNDFLVCRYFPAGNMVGVSVP